mgnify:CR=1 FL=1
MNKIIPYGKHTISQDDIKKVSIVLKSDHITTGPLVEKFEKEFSKKVNSKYATVCSSGTAAIHLALLSISLNKKDNIIIPAINFIAAVNMASIIGANIFLADVDENSGQMTPTTLINCIKKNKLKKIKAIITMYNGGSPNYVKEFYAIKKKYKTFLIEDSCHALGSKYSLRKNLKTGDCKYSDIATFSFHPVKSITTGEGGMITTNIKKIAYKTKILRNHGILRKDSNKKNYNWSYKILDAGFNYRLSDLNCALGINQLKKLDMFVKSRKKIAKAYEKNLKPLSNYIILPKEANDQSSAWHLYIIKFKLKKLKINRNLIIQKLYKLGVATQVHYIPTFYQPKYFHLKNMNLTGAKKYYNRCLSLPIFPDLSMQNVNSICKKIKIIVNRYKKQ